MNEAVQPQKKKRKGCLIPAIITVALVFGIGFGIYQVASNPEKYGGKPASTLSPEDQQAAWLEFDTKTWGDFTNLYTSHNNLIKAMEAFSNSNISAVDLYDKCTEAEEYFRKASLAFDYGTNGDEKTYLEAFRSAALSDQMIAKALKTYVDSNKTSDLATVKKEIENATTAYTTIASNRGTLLVMAGLTDEEIKEKVESDMAKLE